MIRTAVIGLGKMGLSHHAIANTHPDVRPVAVCDTAEYLLGILAKYSKVKTYTDYRKLFSEESLDAVIIATPSRTHAGLTRAALDAGLHVFCEKPFCLDTREGFQLAESAERSGRVNQVGYHYRFVGIFHELKRLLDAEVLGRVHHVRIEAHGPVVLRSKGMTWRSSKVEGGGCLHDYASHAVDLMNYLLGSPSSVRGTALNRLFSSDVEDEVYSNFHFASGATGHIAANWSDESCRKMTVKVTAWGANGKIVADRQELQLFLRSTEGLPGTLRKGWNTLHIMDVTDPVWFYLRGEEYSAQIDHFVKAIKSGLPNTRSTFRTATETQATIDSMIRDAESAALRAPERQLSRIGLRSLVGMNADPAVSAQ